MTPTSDIGSFLWSDHAPIYMELAVSDYRKPQWLWRLNDNLLKDKICEMFIRQAIKEFVQIYETDTTSIPLQWETLKCVLQGLFIKHGARLKADKSKISLLLKEISILENIHKQKLRAEDKMRLNDKRIELQTLVNEQSFHIRDKNRALFYQHGNKPGRLLGRTLKQRQPLTSIIKIQKASGEMTYDPVEISKTFHAYYSKLYNIPTQQNNKDQVENQKDICHYIRETALPVLPKETTVELERDFSLEGIQQAISTLVPGKSRTDIPLDSIRYFRRYLPLSLEKL